MMYFQKFGDGFLAQEAGVTIGKIEDGKFTPKQGLKLTAEQLRDVASQIEGLSKKPTSHEFRRIGDPHSSFAGVCAGLAYAMGVKVWIIRLLALLMFFFVTPDILVVYIILYFIVPTWDKIPEDYKKRTGA